MLRDARIRSGFTQTELAEATGLSGTAINQIEQGKGPWLKAIRTIAKKVGVRLDQIIVSEQNA